MPFGCFSQQYFRELLVEQRNVNSLPLRTVVSNVLATLLSITSVALTGNGKEKVRKFQILLGKD